MPEKPCEACGQDSDFQRRQAIKICDVESENRQLKFDLESAQSINERKDARIRELEGYEWLVKAFDRQATISESASEQMRLEAQARAALARSEGGGA